MMKYLVLVSLLCFSMAVDQDAIVKGIPEIEAVYSKSWYSGYVHVDGNKHMHYFFFPSQGNSSTDPVLLWFNGGPGCSSLLGALYEHGPFIFSDAFAMFITNKYSWNMNASVLYLESPAQVGFSYMDGAYPRWNDDMTAELNLKALIKFYEKWPEYKLNELYISGESYAGVYVPTLAQKIDAFNDNPTPGVDPINLKGFAVGNGCTHPKECGFTTDFPGYLYDLLVDLSFIPKELADKAKEACKNQTTDFTGECNDTIYKIDQLAGEESGMNIYDAYRPCFNDPEAPPQTLSRLYHRAIRATKRNLKKGEKMPPTETPPCVDGIGIDEFLGDATVRDKLHIPAAAPQYAMCTDEDVLGYDKNEAGSYWVYQKLIPKKKYKIVKYSGDTDPAVPITGTFDWINIIRNELQLPTIEYWRPWFVNYEVGKQNAGNIWRMKGLSLVTFRGVGHMAPQWNPAAGLKMINWVMHNTQI